LHNPFAGVTTYTAAFFAHIHCKYNEALKPVQWQAIRFLLSVVLDTLFYGRETFNYPKDVSLLKRF
jgi:hypothetical protein